MKCRYSPRLCVPLSEETPSCCKESSLMHGCSTCRARLRHISGSLSVAINDTVARTDAVRSTMALAAKKLVPESDSSILPPEVTSASQSRLNTGTQAKDGRPAGAELTYSTKPSSACVAMSAGGFWAGVRVGTGCLQERRLHNELGDDVRVQVGGWAPVLLTTNAQVQRCMSCIKSLHI